MANLGADAGPAVRTARIALQWRRSAFASRLATVALLGLVAAVVLGRAELLIVATPSLVVLALAAHRGCRPEELVLRLSLGEQRCFEGDEVSLGVRVESRDVLGEVSVSLEPAPPLSVVGVPRAVRFGVRRADVRWTLLSRRWGRHLVGPVRVRVRTLGLGWVATAVVSAAELTVFPPRVESRNLAVPPHLRARLGAHVGRRPGAGVEFVGTREYVPGDQLRRVNAVMSSRLRTLIVNEYAGEHAADVVAFVDATADVGGGDSSTLDHAVRGAVGVAHAYLRTGDRVGVVGFGARLRWLAPDLGTRQYYRIMEHVLLGSLDGGYVLPALSRLPRPVLPSGCLVYVFSPLLDARVVAAIQDLLQRGHPVVVVDVLTREPPAKETPADQLALRVWRLDRAAMRHGLTQLGAVLVPWDPATGVVVDRASLQPLLGGVR